MQNIVLDTNILMEKHNIIEELLDNYNIILSIVTVEELDNLKVNQNADKAYKARQAIREVENNLDKIEIDVEYGIETKNDNIILSCAKRNDALIGTLDLNMKIKAKGLGIECFEFEDKNEELYRGYKEVVMDEFEMSIHYQAPINKFDLLNNEYLIIKDVDGNIVDKQRWTDEKGFLPISTRGFKSLYFGETKPKDIYQMFAIDSLNNTDFTLLFGVAGSAKTLLSLGWIMQNIQNNKIGKCVVIFNSVPLKNNQSQGFYPGSRTEKLLQSSLGGILSSKFGDMLAVETLINQGKLMVVPTCDIRGIEIASNDCLFVTESQNIDSYTMRTILQRAKEGCKIIVEGDLLEQRDLRNSNINDNGMMRTIEVFKGTKYFSCVKLKNTYRSPISEIAQKI